MARRNRPGRRVSWPIVTALALISVTASSADDRDLLRANSTDPYVFVLLDTSTSMNLSPAGHWVHANGDDPRSRIYQAKETLYDVLAAVDGVRFGFATFNQDQLRVRSKHWLYFVADTAQNADALATLPLAYPAPEPNDEIEVAAAGGGVTIAIDGDLMTFGQAFLAADGTPVAGGGCLEPLRLAGEREKINRFAKLGATGEDATAIWVNDGPRTYRLTFSPDPATPLGGAEVRVRLEVAPVADCAGPVFSPDLRSVELSLRLWRQFLLWDDTAAEVAFDTGSGTASEATGGLWDWHDTLGRYPCGAAKAFSGSGWEGNYDTGPPFGDPALEAIPAGAGVDTWCADPADPGTCTNLFKDETLRDPLLDQRPLDRGDLVPLHWQPTHQDELLSRINPRHGAGGREFGAAALVSDRADSATGLLALRDPAERPLIAAGASPLHSALSDFRCWYQGTESAPCAHYPSGEAFGDGFLTLARSHDGEWACRRTYLLVVTDGESNCPGDAPTEVIAELREAGVQSWVFNLGQGDLTEIVPPESEVRVADGAALGAELRRILGLIREEAGSFAAAAVPLTQANAADKIYLTQFTPVDGAALWPGRIDAFLRPLPMDYGADPPRPRFDHAHHLWEAGAVLTGQAPPADEVTIPVTREALRIGPGPDQRRILYPMRAAGDAVPRTRQLLGPPAGGDLNAIRVDLWQGLGIVAPDFTLTNDPDDVGDLFARHPAEAQRAHRVLRATYVHKTERVGADDKLVTYVLGDVFHSTPLIVGPPSNTRYLANEGRFPGYGDFHRRQARRRQVLFAGANDGMLHAFDAGIFSGDLVTNPELGLTEGRYDDGTGKELFAYVPRTLLRSLTRRAEGEDHRWGVDATPAVADVRIDPRHDGTPGDPEWRTVLVSGLRRGGRSVFALDVTKPDPMERLTQTSASGVRVSGYVPATSGRIPACFAGSGAGSDGGECDRPEALRYPVPLWELTDSDLGETWSKPNLGAILVTEPSGRVMPRFVAIFGGGMDPGGALVGGTGNWLYMVDVATGQPLYKRRLHGSAAAEPAAVDSDQDGFLDRVYVGTTAGYLYRATIAAPAMLVSPCPLAGVAECVTDPAWDPVVVFDTVTTESSGGREVEVRRPIFFPPAVIFSSRLGRYALAFGTGNRDDLWAAAPLGGNRFYLFVDDSDVLPPSALPLTEAAFEELIGEVSLPGSDYLQHPSDGHRGWFLRLGQAGSGDGGVDPGNEKVITPATAISGITTFVTFLPQLREGDDGSGRECAHRGSSRSYVVLTSNGDAILDDGSGQKQRFRTVAAMLSEPFVEQDQSDVPGEPGDPDPCAGTEEVAEILKREIFPPHCRYGNYRFNVRAVRSDTGVECLAQVPICIIEKNWKEF